MPKRSPVDTVTDRSENSGLPGRLMVTRSASINITTARLRPQDLEPARIPNANAFDVNGCDRIATSWRADLETMTEERRESLPYVLPRPPVGRATSAMAKVAPGVREITNTIEGFGAAWDEHNRTVLASKAPLWVALGDSTALGIGAVRHDAGYVGQLAAENWPGAHPGCSGESASATDLAVVNLGVSGARIADVLTHQIPILRSALDRVHLVTCSVGSNDLIRSPNAVAIGIRMRRLFDALGEPETVIVSTLPVGSVSIAGRMVNHAIMRDASRRSLLVARVHSTYGPPFRNKLAADRFHPNEVGYADWAQAFRDALTWLDPTTTPGIAGPKATPGADFPPETNFPPEVTGLQG